MSYTQEHSLRRRKGLSTLALAQDTLFRLGYYTVGRQCLSILIYHSVTQEPDLMRPGVPTADRFKWHMQILDRHFNVLPLSQAVNLIREGRLPPRAACVTFDDGYADNLTVAAPIMQQLNIPATFFIATGYLDGGRMWNDTIIEALRLYPDEELDLTAMKLPSYQIISAEDRRKAAYDIITRIKYLAQEHRNDVATAVGKMVDNLPKDFMLTRSQLCELRQIGMDIGGHTVTHPILARLSGEQARAEIEEGKAELEHILNEPVKLFAYPNGRRGFDYDSNHVKYVRDAGFDAAVSTNHGVCARTTDPFQIPRFTPWDRTLARFLVRMTLNARHRG